MSKLLNSLKTADAKRQMRQKTKASGEPGSASAAQQLEALAEQGPDQAKNPQLAIQATSLAAQMSAEKIRLETEQQAHHELATRVESERQVEEKMLALSALKARTSQEVAQRMQVEQKLQAHLAAQLLAASEEQKALQTQLSIEREAQQITLSKAQSEANLRQIEQENLQTQQALLATAQERLEAEREAQEELELRLAAQKSVNDHIDALTQLAEKVQTQTQQRICEEQVLAQKIAGEQAVELAAKENYLLQVEKEKEAQIVAAKHAVESRRLQQIVIENSLVQQTLNQEQQDRIALETEAAKSLQAKIDAEQTLIAQQQEHAYLSALASEKAAEKHNLERHLIEQVELRIQEEKEAQRLIQQQAATEIIALAKENERLAKEQNLLAQQQAKLAEETALREQQAAILQAQTEAKYLLERRLEAETNAIAEIEQSRVLTEQQMKKTAEKLAIEAQLNARCEEKLIAEKLAAHALHQQAQQQQELLAAEQQRRESELALARESREREQQIAQRAEELVRIEAERLRVLQQLEQEQNQCQKILVKRIEAEARALKNNEKRIAAEIHLKEMADHQLAQETEASKLSEQALHSAQQAEMALHNRMAAEQAVREQSQKRRALASEVKRIARAKLGNDSSNWFARNKESVLNFIFNYSLGAPRYRVLVMLAMVCIGIGIARFSSIGVSATKLDNQLDSRLAATRAAAVEKLPAVTEHLQLDTHFETFGLSIPDSKAAQKSSEKAKR